MTPALPVATFRKIIRKFLEMTPKPLTQSQHTALVRGRYTVQRTLDSLCNMGLIEDAQAPIRVTELGAAYVESRLEVSRRYLARQWPDVPMIWDDESLRELLSDGHGFIRQNREFEAFVMVSDTPRARSIPASHMFQPCQPVATIAPFYWWQVNVEQSAGRFLAYRHTGRKGISLCPLTSDLDFSRPGVVEIDMRPEERGPEGPSLGI